VVQFARGRASLRFWVQRAVLVGLAGKTAAKVQPIDQTAPGKGVATLVYRVPEGNLLGGNRLGAKRGREGQWGRGSSGCTDQQDPSRGLVTPSAPRVGYPARFGVSPAALFMRWPLGFHGRA
jgi:hypothetical protein